MTMTIGLTGAHRTGKTTLAAEFAQQHKIEFVQTSTSAVMKELGIDPKADVSLTERIRAQHAILDALERAYEGKSGFVTDRTPLDTAAYLLADVQRENTTPEQSEEVTKYIERCMHLCNRHFGLMVLIPPAIKLVDAEGKAPANRAYVDHIHFLISGMIKSPLLSHTWWTAMPSSIIELEDRKKWLQSARNITLEQIAEKRESFERNGGRVH